jgi:hypothetical protein
MVTDLSRIRSSPDAEAVLAVLRHHVPELGANGGVASVRIMPTIIQTSAESSAA